MENLVFYAGLFVAAVPLTAAFALLLDQGYSPARKWIVLPLLCLEGVAGLLISFAVIDRGHEEAMKKRMECSECPEYLWTEHP